MEVTRRDGSVGELGLHARQTEEALQQTAEALESIVFAQQRCRHLQEKTQVLRTLNVSFEFRLAHRAHTAVDVGHQLAEDGRSCTLAVLHDFVAQAA